MAKRLRTSMSMALLRTPSIALLPRRMGLIRHSSCTARPAVLDTFQCEGWLSQGNTPATNNLSPSHHTATYRSLRRHILREQRGLLHPRRRPATLSPDNTRHLHLYQPATARHLRQPVDICSGSWVWYRLYLRHTDAPRPTKPRVHHCTRP